jgi:hypothetical protein
VDKPIKPFQEIIADLKHKKICFAAGDVTRPETAKVDPAGGDYGAGLITDVVMAKVGRALGWDWNVDQSGIQQIVDFANAETTGLKCRYEHPEGFAADLGTAVGVLKNARVVGEMAVADLHILKSADLSPLGKLGSYVLGLATEQPEFLSLSIFGSVKEFYFNNANGEKVVLIAQEQWDQFYEAGPGAQLFISIAELTACDLVDKGALTEGLFAASAAFKQQLADNQKISFKQKTMSKGKRLAFSINATTDANVEITIKTDNPTPAVGDEVVAVDADGVETPAPDGPHTISGGTLDGSVVTVKDGKIESIEVPAAASEGEKPAADVAASAGNKSVLDALVKLEAKLDARLAHLEASPLAFHSGKKGGDTFQGNQSAAEGQSEWEKIALERGKNRQSTIPKLPD